LLAHTTTGKPLPALFLGPLYNRSFKEKAKDLDEALSALERRVSTLRDRTIVRTGETVETIKENLRLTGVKIDGLSDIDQARKDARDALAMILEEKTRTADCA
jgi:urocanate hydratase